MPRWSRAAALVLVALALPAPQAGAQTTPDPAADARGIEATRGVVLAHVLTGNTEVDETAAAGLRAGAFGRAAIPVGEAVTIRRRRPQEWHPNGRTTLTLAGDGTVLMARDAPAAPLAVRAQNALYPLHSARMADSPIALPLRIVMTLAGLGLALLGSLAVVTFWRAQVPARIRKTRMPQGVGAG
jgi:uncharacterized iron-regulated membrane protein